MWVTTPSILPSALWNFGPYLAIHWISVHSTHLLATYPLNATLLFPFSIKMRAFSAPKCTRSTGSVLVSRPQNFTHYLNFAWIVACHIPFPSKFILFPVNWPFIIPLILYSWLTYHVLKKIGLYGEEYRDCTKRRRELTPSYSQWHHLNVSLWCKQIRVNTLLPLHAELILWAPYEVRVTSPICVTQWANHDQAAVESWPAHTLELTSVRSLWLPCENNPHLQ